MSRNTISPRVDDAVIAKNAKRLNRSGGIANPIGSDQHRRNRGGKSYPEN